MILKTVQKERMKAISLILRCYNRRFELVKFEPEVNKLKEYIDNVNKSAKEIARREKASQA
jgi:seryl-tRNA(Sec) selenium transferase